MLPRVRYAPSPTGFQHIGGLRTALFNYLFAHSQRGTFILRIEDTDASRCKQEYVDDMLESLQWLAIYPDEHTDNGPYAPYIQSQRKQRYQEIAQRLLEEGHAYYCYTSSMQKKGDYDRSSRNLSAKEISIYQDKVKKGEIKPVIRLKLPIEGELGFDDMILGSISHKFQDMIIDPILLKSDNMPTYHLANVVDDNAMHITHVLRSQEWIPTTPVHVYIYKVLGWNIPIYAHLPMVLGDDGQKLSKRNGSISIKELRNMGILSEALINCITLLGWSFDDSREFFTLEELVKNFMQGKIQKNPAKFSMEKLRWFNAHYIKLCSDETLTKMIIPFLEKKYNVTITESYKKILQNIVPSIKERMECISDVNHLLQPLFHAPNINDAIALVEVKSITPFIEGLSLVESILKEKKYTSPEEFENVIRSKSKEVGIKLGNVLMPFRIALTGSKISPPILVIALAMEYNEILKRVHDFLELLRNRKEKKDD